MYDTAGIIMLRRASFGELLKQRNDNVVLLKSTLKTSLY